MSADFYYSIPESQRSPLQKVATLASSVTGESLDTIGAATPTIHLGSRSTQHQFYIARNVTHPCILGWDFFTKHGASISSLTSTFSFLDSTIPLVDRHQHQAPLRCNVSLVGTATLPGMSETHVHGRLVSPQADVIPQDYDGIFEPSMDEHHQVAGAKSLFRPQDGLILVRLINPSSESVKLPADMHLGQFHSMTGQNDEEYAVVEQKIAATKPELRSDVECTLSTSGLTEQEYMQAQELLCSYQDVFSSSSDDIGQTTMSHHEIHTTTDKPIHQRAYRTSPAMRLEIEKHADNMLKRGIIQHSYSPWASPIVMVKKKDNTYRFCIDYRALNAVTVKDSHPIPRQDDTIDALSSSTFFSVIDLSAGYWQVPLDPNSKEKTAFTTGTGLYEFNVMPFGLVNAPMTFQRLMERVLQGLHWSTCLVYLDDCIILGQDFTSHLANLKEVLQRVREAGLKLKPSKCQLFKKQFTYLGHVISSAGVLPDPSNISKVAALSRPRTATQVRSFLGLASFYRRFIPAFSKVAAPLTNLTQKRAQFVWTDECESAFNALKQALVQPPILAYPDFSAKFLLATDASQDAIGAVLSQIHEGKERVVAYYSQKLTSTQQKWSTYDRELWAIVASVRHYRHYLRGQEFDVITDHRPLLSYNRIPIQDDASGRRARWVVELNAYTFKIVHRQGRLHQNADALSRLPDQSQRSAKENQTLGGNLQMNCSMVNTRSATRDASLDQPGPESTNPQSRDTADEAPENFILANHNADLHHHQKQDKEIQEVITYINSGRHPTVRVIQRQTPRLRRFLWQLPRLVCEDGILYRRRQDNSGITALQVVIPEAFVPRILEELHGSPSSGHFGIQRTLLRAESMCYWPFMHRDITNYCNTCTACESMRSPNPKHQAPLKSIKTDHPLQMVVADIAELPTSRNGYRYILVVVDHFSKYTNIYAMRDQTAKTVAKHLFEDYTKEHGIPESLHTDQGRQFESRIVQDLCQRLGIRKSRSSPYHPQGAGIVERANRVIKGQLARYMADRGGQWDTHIHQLQLAYNTSVHSSTGLTPYYIMHGREARIPANVTCPVAPPSYDSAQEYVADVCTRLKKAFQYARQKADLSQLRQKKDYDAGSRTIEYRPGDLVWLHDPVNARNKLEPNWRGPFAVKSTSRDGLNYSITDIHDGRTKVVHHNRLKIFRSKVSLENSGLPIAHGQQGTPEDRLLSPSSNASPRSSIEVQLPAPEPVVHSSLDDGTNLQRRGDSSVQPSWAEQSSKQAEQSTQQAGQSTQQAPPVDQTTQRPSRRLSSHQQSRSRSEETRLPAQPDQRPGQSNGEHLERPPRLSQSHSVDPSASPGPSNIGDLQPSTMLPEMARDDSASGHVGTHRSDDPPGEIDSSVPARQSRYGRTVRRPQKFGDFQM